ncbi:magnesium chelatase subunit D [Aurantimonas sp. HBX-1]|uniref:magnesium chelatase subunit D n=1 Tax=Aurantimonas sp. HBX-1 TaxID=2906072 RepID=UPI001F436CD2|nr:magnesium chelatase subunit D [Aurantimonas sp. HBX-1]UIJ73272.1 magnesium chelatase subunit D [Aurantimonas sp. HBX-1]
MSLPTLSAVIDRREGAADPLAEASVDRAAALWAEALEAVTLFAVDPAVGLWLRARPGFARDSLIARLAALLPADEPFRRMPAGCAPDALAGGVDLAATLAAGRPIARAGLLAATHRGVLVAAMAERMTPQARGLLVQCLDTGAVRIEREGFSAEISARIGLLALDEGIGPDEAPANALCDRLALCVELDGADPRHGAAPTVDRAAIAAARERLPRIEACDETVALLCQAAAAFGVASLRASVLALRVARAAAALAGLPCVGKEEIAAAIRHVLLPRATRLPAAAEPDDAQETDAPPDEPPPDVPPPDVPPPSGDETDGKAQGGAPPADLVVDAAEARLPEGLLARLAGQARPERVRSPAGRSGAAMRTPRHGRVVGTRPGDPRRERLDLVATLVAAAPWQALRRRERPGATGVLVREDDFRVRRYRTNRETATIFAVDASGSAALARLAETKGAVEIILSECYVRRDRVALVAFRGTRAEVLLPETRSLTRAKRALAAFPAGGGTPLAGGIAAALALARTSAREGRTPLIALLTDGRANIGAGGVAGRAAAVDDAHAAARAVRAAGIASLLIDTAQRPGSAARAVADAMGATYLALPRADSRALSAAVSAVARDGPP